MSLDRSTTICVEPRVIVRALASFTVLLVLAHLVVVAVRFGAGHPYVYGLVPLFDLDEENNVPTCFSAFLILFCACLTALIGVFQRRRRDAFAKNWTILAGILFYVSVDEASGIHELLTLPTRKLIGTNGVLYYAWVVPGIVLVAIFALCFWRFVWRLPVPTRRLFAVAATVYVTGAIGIEVLGGWQNYLHGRNNVTYRMLSMVEESLEMTGMLIFAYALLKYLEQHVGAITFEVGANCVCSTCPLEPTIESQQAHSVDGP